jgi:hypothetical protein
MFETINTTGSAPTAGLPRNAEIRRIGEMTVAGSADGFREIQQGLLALVSGIVAADGMHAFQNPRSSVVAHEAGHTVMYGHFRQPVRCVKIWKRKRGPERGQWTGVTMAGTEWRADDSTLVEADFRNACQAIAGVVAEKLFDSDNFRRGSSVDEILTAQMLAGLIARKTDAPPERVMSDIFRVSGQILSDNAAVVREIMVLLERNNAVRKKDLRSILGRVTLCPQQFAAAGSHPERQPNEDGATVARAVKGAGQ